MTSDPHDGDGVQPPRSHAGHPDPCALVEAIITTPGETGTAPYDLAWLFTCWAWEAGFRDWQTALRVLARVLRGLERSGLVERRAVRRAGQLTHHGFVLTDAGREAVTALSGHWIEEAK
jgi:hypothetical protein